MSFLNSIFIFLDDELYGKAPWMGTLRHVNHENMVTKTIKPTPKFKKYPDEDAPNPFKGMQGKNAENPFHVFKFSLIFSVRQLVYLIYVLQNREKCLTSISLDTSSSFSPSRGGRSKRRERSGGRTS